VTDNGIHSSLLKYSRKQFYNASPGRTEKTGVFVLGKFFQTSLIFARKTEAYGCLTLWVLSQILEQHGKNCHGRTL
jgi:hypothetical protein